MKIRYKHQRFQAEATKCVSDVFQGQPKHDGSRTFLNKIDEIGLMVSDGFGKTCPWCSITRAFARMCVVYRWPKA